MAYDLVYTSLDTTVQSTLDDLKKYNVSRVVLSPTRWALFSWTTPLSWNVVRFEESAKDDLPKDKQGVYTFVVKPEIANHPDCAYLLYVGKTEKQGLRTRFLDYFREPKKPKGREAVKLMLRLWKTHLWFCYAPIDDVGEINHVERNLIEALVPPINQEYSGVLGKAVKAWQ